MAISSGEMRHRVRIEQRSTAQDASGAQIDKWTLVSERWASVEPLVGREYFASQQRQAKGPTRFRMRWIELTPAHRIVWKGRWFDVVDVAEVNGIHHELVVIADERIGVAP